MLVSMLIPVVTKQVAQQVVTHDKLRILFELSTMYILGAAALITCTALIIVMAKTKHPIIWAMVTAAIMMCAASLLAPVWFKMMIRTY
jgi:predicted regulator of amino acid metabolism with ACT domain